MCTATNRRIDEQLKQYARRIEELARELGLDFYPVDFELVPNNFMMEIAVYGLPVRMPHWSFGVRYIHQLIRQGMGHSRIFEVMFPGDPCHAYLVNDNTLAGKYAGHRACAGPCRFRQEQSSVRAFHGNGRRPYPRTGGRTRASDRSTRSRNTARNGSKPCSMPRLRWNRISISTRSCIAPPIRVRAEITERSRQRRCRSSSVSALCRAKNRRRRRPHSTSVRRFRRSRNTICCGSSPTMRRSWKTGSAIFFSRCAKNRSTSIRSSPARS